MAIIKQLDPHIANLIAAGEVIERAASVVKELVENSIDANAKNISIHLIDSGVTEIRVIDDGNGMDPADAKMCVLPHATSKIKNENDLFTISTLGFRGEALPSIVSVSNFRLVTSTDGYKGYMYSLKGGVPTTEAIVAHDKGTEIVVKNLFFNTPARLQNLQSQNVELSHITELVTKIAFANPNISFTLTNNEKLLIKTSGNGDLLEVIASIIGTESAKNMFKVFDTNGTYRVSGYISNNTLTRSSKNYMYLFINGRTIKSYNINNAIIKGYDTLLMGGKYPVVVLNIEADVSLVDVNVHPTKAEVRFYDEEGLLSMITGMVANCLKKQNLSVNMVLSSDTKEEKNNNEDDDFINNVDLSFDDEDEQEQEELSFDDEDDDILHQEMPDLDLSIEDDFDEELEEENDDFEEDSEEELFTSDNEYIEETTETSEETKSEKVLEADLKNLFSMDDEEESNEDEEPQYENILSEPNTFTYDSEEKQEVYEQQQLDLTQEEPKEQQDKIGLLYYIGQLFGTYILAQTEKELVVIDQHAAAERINYEKILSELEKDENFGYDLLVPFNLEFTPSEMILIKENIETINKLGILIEEFGSNTYIVRTIPTWIFRGKEKEFVEEIITQIIHGVKTSKKEFLNSLSKSLACKKSIKANEYHNQIEIEYMLDDLRNTSNPYTCPHGRPIIIKFDKYEIEKWFKRVV